jgi:hypothetical protein
LPEWDFYRTNYPDWPYLKGIGRLLIATAAKLSVALRWKGKLTLNSVPEAIDFYVNAGHFEIKGSVAPGVCTVMVLTEEGAAKLLEGD